MENLRGLVLLHIELEEFFEFVAKLSSPLFGAKRLECWMLERVLNVGERVKLQEFARAGEVLPTCV